MMENNFNIEEVHISQIRVGDVVLHDNNETETVCRKYLKYDSFMGIALFGSSYKLGRTLVKRSITK